MAWGCWGPGAEDELGLLGTRGCGSPAVPCPQPAPCPQMNFIAAAFHDGVMLYAQAVNETLERGGSITNASAITRQMWNRTFYGGRPVPVPSPSCPRPVPVLIPAPAGLGAARPPRSQAGILGSEPAGWRFTALGTTEPPSPPALALCPVPWLGSLARPRAPRPPSPGVTGFLKIDENGDRESDYSLWDMDPVRGDFQVRASPSAGSPRSPGGYRGSRPTRVSSPSQIVANYNGTTKKIHMVPGRDIHWPGNKVPPDVPPCGFDNNDPQCHKGERRGETPSGQGPGRPRPPHRPPLAPQPA